MVDEKEKSGEANKQPRKESIPRPGDIATTLKRIIDDYETDWERSDALVFGGIESIGTQIEQALVAGPEKLTENEAMEVKEIISSFMEKYNLADKYKNYRDRLEEKEGEGFFNLPAFWWERDI